MATKTFDEWVQSTYSFVHPNMIAELKPCWDAATKAELDEISKIKTKLSSLELRLCCVKTESFSDKEIISSVCAELRKLASD